MKLLCFAPMSHKCFFTSAVTYPLSRPFWPSFLPMSPTSTPGKARRVLGSLTCSTVVTLLLDVTGCDKNRMCSISGPTTVFASLIRTKFTLLCTGPENSCMVTDTDRCFHLLLPTCLLYVAKLITNHI